jgi:hypothetical protein
VRGPCPAVNRRVPEPAESALQAPSAPSSARCVSGRAQRRARKGGAPRTAARRRSRARRARGGSRLARRERGRMLERTTGLADGAGETTGVGRWIKRVGRGAMDQEGWARCVDPSWAGRGVRAASRRGGLTRRWAPSPSPLGVGSAGSGGPFTAAGWASADRRRHAGAGPDGADELRLRRCVKTSAGGTAFCVCEAAVCLISASTAMSGAVNLPSAWSVGERPPQRARGWGEGAKIS